MQCPEQLPMHIFSIFKAVSVRLCLLLHNILTVWRVTVNWNHDQFWLLLFANVPFILEGAYTVTRRKGIEWKWMCPCFLFFLCSTVPGIWLLEISSMNTYSSINSSAVEDIVISGVNIPIRLSADTWNLVVEESLLYLMILGRWFLPRGEVSREQLSELLFAFIGIASDIMELFSLFDENQVRSSKAMTYALLAVWSWSILQFIFIITVSHRPKRKRIQRILPEGEDKKNMVKYEILGIFVSLFMQDIPFLVLRLYTIATFNLINYSLVFFAAKNVLVILLMWYRLVIMFSNHYCKNRGKRDQFENNLPFDGLGPRNYVQFPDDKTSYILDNDGFINDEDKRRSNGDSKTIHLVDSEYGETSSSHKESSPDRTISLENVYDEETDVKLPIDVGSSVARTETGKQTDLIKSTRKRKIPKSTSNESMDKHESEKSTSNESMCKQESAKSVLNESMDKHESAKSTSNESMDKHESAKSTSNESMDKQESTKSTSKESMHKKESAKSTSNQSMDKQESAKSTSNESMDKQESAKSTSNESMDKQESAKSASGESTSKRESSTFYGTTVHTENDKVSEHEDVITYITPNDDSEQNIDSSSKRHISIINVHM